ncbi:MAG: protein kinase [Deltaproteobacteria bacterium]|jgi:DNA-binding response OmpR family regulator|nr:protein kinase [Deltaproteobacteria bacterium]
MTSEAARHILVAEDDDTNRTMLRLYLEKRGFTVSAVSNGLEVLEALDQGPFDLVLLDWMMPVLSGIDALARLRQSHPDLPVIMLTAVGGTTDVVGALELGADDYVTKPYELPVLMARIDARLRRRERPSTPVAVTGSTEVGPGLVIDDRYELLEQVGAGAFGVVFRARHKTLETEFAIKVLRTVAASGTELLTPIDSRGRPQGKAISAEQAEEFRREGVRACRVQHPNAVRVFDYGTLPFGPSYLVMELLRGRTLDDELHEHGRLSVHRAVEVLVPVCQALAAAHDQHVIHRDIKPQNIFLHQTPSGEVVKVLDFGVAKLTDTGSEATRDAIAGSPAYMAPERLRGRPYDGRSDVYAVGITLYELLTGEVPFRSGNSDVMAVALMQLRDEPVPPSEAEPALPKALDARVLELLVKEPAKRPTAAQAVERLQDLLDAVA